MKKPLFSVEQANMFANSKIINLELEQYLLGAIIAKPSRLGTLGDLQAKHFYFAEHREIFSFVKGLTTKELDLEQSLILAKADPDHKSYIYKVCGIGSGVTNIRGYADATINLARARELVEYFEEASKEFNTETDYDSILTKIQSIVQTDRQYEVKTEKEVSLEIYKELEQELICCSTGYDKIDRAMEGGLYPGKAYGFNGGQKSGKTIILASISHNLSLQNISHLYMALEMGSKEIHKRLIARDLGRNSISFYNKRIREKPDFKSAVADNVVSSHEATKYFDCPGITFDQLQASLPAMVRKYKIKGIFLDYFQLITGKAKGENGAEFLDRVASWFASFIKRENIFLVAASQLNREGQIRGGDGMKAAFDQIYYIRRREETKDSGLRWLELAESRYTIKQTIGDETNPAFKILRKSGPYLSENVADETEEFSEGITSY